MKRSAAAAAGMCGVLAVVLVQGWTQPAARRAGGGTPIHEGRSGGAAVIVTAAPVYQSLAALYGRERFPRGAQLMVLRDGRSEPLVAGFASSADASVSFDGKTVLFAGKKSGTEPWQIWEMAVEGGAPRRVLAAKTDLIRPLWMPDGRMVYARREAQGFALETAGLDGKGTLRLSYLPGNFVPDDVLLDGRVLFEANFPLGAEATLQPAARSAGSQAEMFLVYADGSGVESVRCDHPDGVTQAGREHGRQIGAGSRAGNAGDIVFVQKGRLERFISARAGEDPISAPAAEYAGDVAELPDGRWLLAARKQGAQQFAMTVWTPGESALRPIAEDARRNLVEPVVVAPRAVPNRHPTALHEWSYGNLLALDARQSQDGTLKAAPAAVKAETMGADGRVVALGTAPVEKDGSFFVQATGDRPLRFILLDAAGNTLREEHGWFWVRRGEQRICVGCHTGPERAPENRVPQVLLRTTTPVDLTGGAMETAGGGKAAAGGRAQ